MERFLDMNNRVFGFLNQVADLIILNLLWLVCCIPVITIGPSTAALYYSTIKIVKNEDGPILKMFFHSFRQNLKQGILLTLIYLVAGIFLAADIRICLTLNVSMIRTILAGLLFLTIVFLMTLAYIFPLLAVFENTVKNLLKNAFLISISNLLNTLAIVAMDLLPVIFLFIDLSLIRFILPVWTLLGAALTARINSRLLVKIFEKYMPSE